MRVWIVNPFDNLPLEGYRPQRYWLMARGFVVAGHSVVYWTSDFSHATKRKRVLVCKPSEGFAVRLVPSMAYPANVCIRRLVSHWRLARTWRRLAERETERPDVVIASTPPLGLCSAALRYAKKHGVFFVADIMDAWPETFERIVPKWMLHPMRRMARRIYTQADAISAVAERYVDLARSYGATVPVKLSYHGIEIGDEGCWMRNEGEHPSIIKLAYMGSFGASYDLETTIAAVRQVPNVTLDIAGSGPKEAVLRKLADGCGRIRFHGYLADVEMKKLLRNCDIGLVPMFPESCVGVPYKLADYAAARLRIIESLGGETGAMVDRFDVGVHYKAGDVNSLCAAIEDLRKRRSQGRFDEFVAEFDARVVMPKYVDWIEGLRCGGGGH